MANIPTVGGICTAVFIFAFAVLAGTIVYNINPMEEKEVARMCFIGLCSFAALIIILAGLNNYVVKKYITAPFLKDNEIALIYYVEKGKEVIFFDKPLWGKFSFSIIRLPKGWIINMADGSERIINFTLKNLTSLSRMVIIPVKIKFTFTGSFTAQDFLIFLPVLLSNQTISLEEKIKELFDDIIDPRGNTDVEEFLNKKISQEELGERLSLSVGLSKLFSNVKEPIIMFGKLIVSSRNDSTDKEKSSVGYYARENSNLC